MSSAPRTRSLLGPQTSGSRAAPARLAVGLLCALVVPACSPSEPARPGGEPALAEELVLFNWSEDIPQAVLDSFTAEFGVTVKYLTFDSMEEAVPRIRGGRMAWDVAVLESDVLASLIEAGLLADIDFRNVPNFRNVSANFRDLAADPGNRHSIPYHYGTSGLLVRTDLVGNSARRWSDLWNPRFRGSIALRDQPREVLGLTLLSLGLPPNSEDPDHVEAALRRLRELKPFPRLLGVEAAQAVPALLGGEVSILQGWAEDYRVALEKDRGIRYVVPEEGCMLWLDNFVVSARSDRKRTAEVFLNYLLRPAVSASLVNAKKYANANEAALAFVDRDVREDPVIYPPPDRLRNARFWSPLSEKGLKLYDDAWARLKGSGGSAARGAGP